jgi:hypothetical protein
VAPQEKWRVASGKWRDNFQLSPYSDDHFLKLVNFFQTRSPFGNIRGNRNSRSSDLGN